MNFIICNDVLSLIILVRIGYPLEMSLVLRCCNKTVAVRLLHISLYAADRMNVCEYTVI